MVTTFSNSGTIIGALVVYFLIIIGIGIFYSRRSNNTQDFILADHNLTTPYITASVVATWIGGAVILGGAKEAFIGGFQYIVWDPWSPVLTLLLSGFFLVRIFRKSKHVTVVDYYNSRFNNKIGGASLVINVLACVSWLSAQLLSLGVIIRLITGMNLSIATLIGAVVILIIALAGGLWALSRSDMLAFIIMAIVLIIMLPFAFGSVGGVGAFIENAGTWEGLPPFSLFYTNELAEYGEPAGFSGYVGALGIFYMLAAWFSVALGDAGGPVLTARALAAKDESSATKGFVFGGIIYLILGMIPVIIGMCVFILRPEFPEEQLDNIFPWFVQNYIPEWIGVLFFVAVASAIVSTAGDTILSNGAMIGYTAQKMINPKSTDQQRLSATRIAMVGFTVAALIFGLALGNLYNLLVFAGALGFPTMSAVYLCGILWKKANNTGAWAGIVAGCVSWIALVFVFLGFEDIAGDIWESIYMSSVPAFVISLLALIIVSLATQKSDPPNPIRDVDGNDISNTKLFLWSKGDDEAAKN
ncbi:MAG: hypothetical protein MJA31_21035 [Clostridia bacterium]|nr:hypothetical protein [Clostridia bacterium]